MTIRMTITRNDRKIDVEVDTLHNPTAVEHVANLAWAGYELTPEEKSFALNLCLERLEKGTK